MTLQVSVPGGTRAGWRKLVAAWPDWVCECGAENRGYLVRCACGRERA